MSDRKSNGVKRKHPVKQERPERRSKKTALLAAALAVFAIALAVTVGLLLRKDKEAPQVGSEEIPKRNVVVTEKNAEEIASELAAEDYVEPGYYTVNMATEWHFSTGDSISDNARVDNVAGNTNPVYFDVFLAEDETEPVYRSPVIPVGSFLEKIALDKPLEKGNYDCVMIYHLVDDDQNTISTLRVTMKITVD